MEEEPTEEAIARILHGVQPITGDLVQRVQWAAAQIEYALESTTDAETLRAWLRTIWRTLTHDEETKPDENGCLPPIFRTILGQ